MANDFQTILFADFRGRAEIQRTESREPQKTPESEKLERERVEQTRRVISELNLSSITIAQEIQKELERVLPPTVTIRVQISFYESSIGWTGVMVLMGTMALISDTMGFINIMSNVMRTAIDNVTSKWIIRSGIQIIQNNGQTQVNVSPTLATFGMYPNSVSNVNTPATNVLPQAIEKADIWGITERHAKFTMANTILLAILLLLQILPLLGRLAIAIQSVQP